MQCKACGLKRAQYPRALCRRCDIAAGTYVPIVHVHRDRCRRCGQVGETRESLCGACWQVVNGGPAANRSDPVPGPVRERTISQLHPGELEVVWPRHKWDYLTVPDPDVPADPPPLASTWADTAMDAVDATPTPLIVAAPGRDLAARALLGAECSQQRVSDLFGVSRRTIGRMTDADCSTALRDPQLLEVARTCLAETSSRGSTAEEREAAAARLAQAARDEHQVAVKPTAVKPRVSTSQNRKARVHARRPTRNGAHRNGAHRNGAGHPQKVPVWEFDRQGYDPGSARACAPLIHVDALRRQQLRILHHSEIINYVLAAEKRAGDPLTIGDALAELLADITEAARTIGTLLLTTNGRP